MVDCSQSFYGSNVYGDVDIKETQCLFIHKKMFINFFTKVIRLSDRSDQNQQKNSRVPFRQNVLFLREMTKCVLTYATCSVTGLVHNNIANAFDENWLNAQYNSAVKLRYQIELNKCKLMLSLLKSDNQVGYYLI